MFVDTSPVEALGADGQPFHPELRRLARLLPRYSPGLIGTRLIRGLRRRKGLAKPPVLADVAVRDRYIDGPDGQRLRLRLYSPAAPDGPTPALLWMHGGGYLIGHPEQDEDHSIALCRQLGITVATVAYRLGPEAPFPGPLEDCYSALGWLHESAGELGLDTSRIAVGGASAGAGLAAALAMLAHDRGGPPIPFQLLVYPMIDDRTALRTDIDTSRLRICSPSTNALGWRSYIGQEPGSDGISAYAAAARREDLSDLPPAWIGVGTCDLYLDEAITFAARLNAAGVRCSLKLVEGAFHAFDRVAPRTQVVADFRQSYFDALAENLRD